MCIYGRLSYLFGSNQYQRIISCRIGNVQQVRPAKHIHLMQTLGNTSMTEHQFCQLLGRMRLYQCLPQGYQKAIPRMLLTDTQVNSVAKATLMMRTLAVLAVTYPCGSSTTCLLAATRAAT